MHWIRAAVTVLAVTACGLQPLSAEKVMFRHELTGGEMWRISSFNIFQEYPSGGPGKPFSEEGLWVTTRALGSAAVAAFNMADGPEVLIGKDHPGDKREPAFLHRSGRTAVIYMCTVLDRQTNKAEVRVYVYDLKTTEERCTLRLPRRFMTRFVSVIGPRSEYAQIMGDLTGDGLSDWAVKSIWTDEPPRVVLSRPDADVYGSWPSPSLVQTNRTTLHMTVLDPSVAQEAAKPGNDAASEKSHRPDSRFEVCVAELDLKTLTPTLYRARGAHLWGHGTWTGDGKYVYLHHSVWEVDRNKPSVPVRIGNDLPQCDHYGPCGAMGRYVVADQFMNGMEEIYLFDLWTGERQTLTHVSVTNNEKGGQLDRAHAMGSPDGTKVLIRSCYERVNHRQFAIPTQDVNPGDTVIPVETTEGFPENGALMYGFPHRVKIAYDRKDATHFYGCDWGQDAQAQFGKALADLTRRYGPVESFPKGSLYLTGALGRYTPKGDARPPKGYIVVAKAPDPPRALAAALTEGGQSVRLTWQPAANGREIAGYAVWRQLGDNPIQRLTPEPVPSCEHRDKRPLQGKMAYWVHAVEWSGLHGAWCGPAWVDGARTGLEALDSYDVPGCNYMTPDEPIIADRRQVRVQIPAVGDYVLWGRGRAYEEPETIQVLVDGKPLADARMEGAEWRWSQLASCPLAAGEHVIELAREETLPVRKGNLLRNPGFENGLEGWAGDESVMSVDRTQPRSGRHSSSSPVTSATRR